MFGLGPFSLLFGTQRLACLVVSFVISSQFAILVVGDSETGRDIGPPFLILNSEVCSSSILEDSEVRKYGFSSSLPQD